MIWNRKKRSTPTRLSARVGKMTEGELAQWTESVFSDLGRVLRASSRTPELLREAETLSEALHSILMERANRI